MRKLNEQSFCGWCGGKLIYAGTWDSKCKECNYRNYIAPKPTCTVMIKDADNKVLMFKRAIEPLKGKFDFPGGFVDITDSSIEQASLREIQEELGLRQKDITQITYSGSSTAPYEWDDSTVPTLTSHFVCTIKDSTAMSLDQAENESFHWMTKDGFHTIDFAWENDRVMLAKLWNITL